MIFSFNLFLFGHMAVLVLAYITSKVLESLLLPIAKTLSNNRLVY